MLRANPDKLLINLVPQLAGGGLQNALSFLEVLRMQPEFLERSLVLVRGDGPISEFCRSSEIDRVEFDAFSRNRIVFESMLRRIFAKEQLCFSLWGLHNYASRRWLLNVGGCALSNLFYPELDFWGYLDRMNGTKKRLIDEYRIFMIKSLDYWIFETDILAERAIRLANFPANRVSVVKMAPSKLVMPSKVKEDIVRGLEQELPQSKRRILVLCGAHPNKRQHLLCSIAKYIIELGTNDIVFITTMDEKSRYFMNVRREFQENEISASMHNMGYIPQENVASIISCCEAMLSISLLESFSNNFVEAWNMQTPLIVGDYDWARGSCGEAAFYIDPLNAKNSAEGIIQVLENDGLSQMLTTNGTARLREYNTPERKNEMYFDILLRASSMGKCPEDLRRKISFPKAEVI